MSSAVPNALLAALLYAGTATAGLCCSARLCCKLVPFADGPAAGRPPSAMLIAGSALIGAALSSRGAALSALFVCAMLVASLVASWYSDVRCGLVPDVFTLVPLGIVLVIALLHENPWPFMSAAILFIPFACAALASQGLGMGWGDVKLVALGAAALGLQTSLLSCAAACLAAAAVAVVRGRRNAPIAFAPYLAASIAVALTLPRAQ